MQSWYSYIEWPALQKPSQHSSSQGPCCFLGLPALRLQANTFNVSETHINCHQKYQKLAHTGSSWFKVWYHGILYVMSFVPTNDVVVVVVVWNKTKNVQNIFLVVDEFIETRCTIQNENTLGKLKYNNFLSLRRIMFECGDCFGKTRD